ncbi:MAG: MFS transporter [Haloechinothrix sp.]
MSETRDNRLNWLLSSSAMSNLGDGMGKVAFPLLAATLTREPILIAGLAATQFLPWLLFALLAGALVDRVDRRKAMLVANGTRAVAIGLMAALVYADLVSIWVIYAAALLVGTAETVADSAANVIVPSVVERGRLESANSKLQSAEIVGQTFLGGPIGSVTFALFAAFPFLLNSAAFGLAAVLLLGMAGTYEPKGRSDGRPIAPRNLRADLADGIHWLRGSPLLTRLVIIAGLLALTSEFAQAQLVLYALEDLDLNEAAFGLFAFVGGIGGLLGAAVAPRLIQMFSRRSMLAVGIVAAGLGFGGMGLTANAIVAALLFGLFAAAIVTVNVILATLRHMLVPNELLGRVLGVWRTVVWGAVPVGALIGGVLTEVFGTPSETFLFSGGCQIALAVAAFFALRHFNAEVDSAGSKTDSADHLTRALDR